MPIPAAAFSILIIFISLSPAQSAQVRRNYIYYPISAATEKGLIKALSQNGPYLAQTKQRHPAAAAIEFKNSLKLRQKGKYCALAQADIIVNAKIYLPQWRQRGKAANTKLTRFWDMLITDMRRHEAQHISIAYAHALRMEQELRALPARRSCAVLRADADIILKRVSQNNAAAQLEFDEKEAKRVARALKKRRENAQNK